MQEPTPLNFLLHVVLLSLEVIQFWSDNKLSVLKPMQHISLDSVVNLIPSLLVERAALRLGGEWKTGALDIFLTWLILSILCSLVRETTLMIFLMFGHEKEMARVTVRTLLKVNRFF